MLKRRVVILILIMIFVLSGLSFVSILFFLDPYLYRYVAVSLLIVSFVGTLTCFLSLGLYFFKKIYFRGEVGMYHIFSSVRQGFLFSLVLGGSIYVYGLEMQSVLPILLIVLSGIFLELFIQNS